MSDDMIYAIIGVPVFPFEKGKPAVIFNPNSATKKATLTEPVTDFAEVAFNP